MRPDLSFPYNTWLDFRRHEPVRALLQSLPTEAQTLSDWPEPQQWQEFASQAAIWDELGQTLLFTLEEKLGQRARRKKERVIGRSYEASICERREIPTRAKNLHDFFNAIVWLNFPLAKYALHRRAYEIQNDWWKGHGREKRCPLADRLTCFDEGGLIFSLPPGLDRREVEALLLSRDDEEKARMVKSYREHFTLFGHGMMEVMMKGNVAIHAACILLEAGHEAQDQRLARYLSRFDEASPDHGSVNVSCLMQN